MSMRSDRLDADREIVWEALDRLAVATGRSYRQSPLWRSLGGGPAMWQAVTFVTREALRVGIIRRVGRGLYRIAADR